MRREDWPERLVEYIDARRDRPFEWGHHDCVLAAANWVEVATGVDPIPAWRGKWNDARSAAFLIKQAGGIEHAVTTHMGRPLDSIVRSFRGDIALTEQGGRKVLGIVLDAGIACPCDNGLVVVPLAEARTVWRV